MMNLVPVPALAGLRPNGTLRFEGKDLRGESRADGHEDEIDIYSWSWGMTQSGTFHTGKGPAAGRVNVQDLTITKFVDYSSPKLMALCCNGAPIAAAKLFSFKSSGAQALEHLVIEMKKVMIVSVQSMGAPGQEMVLEEVKLNFAEFRVIFTAQDPDSGGAAGQSEMGWDIAANRTA